MERASLKITLYNVLLNMLEHLIFRFPRQSSLKSISDFVCIQLLSYRLIREVTDDDDGLQRRPAWCCIGVPRGVGRHREPPSRTGGGWSRSRPKNVFGNRNADRAARVPPAGYTPSGAKRYEIAVRPPLFVMGSLKHILHRYMYTHAYVWVLCLFSTRPASDVP